MLIASQHPLDARRRFARTCVGVLLPVLGMVLGCWNLVAADHSLDLLRNLLSPEAAPANLPNPTNAITREKLELLKSERVCFKTFPWISETPLTSFADKSKWQEEVRNGMRAAVYAAIQSQAVNEVSSTLQRLTKFNFETFEKVEFVISQGLIDQAQYSAHLNTPERLIFDKLFSLSPVERRMALRLSAGADPEQIRLYADFLQCASGKVSPDLVSSCFEEAKARSKLTVMQQPCDEAEAATYFSKQSLINMMAIYDYKARARRSPQDLKGSIELAGEFLDNSPALQPHFIFCGDPTGNILSLFNGNCLRKLDLDAPDWQRFSTLSQIEFVHGFIRDGSSTTLFLGKSRVSAIECNGNIWTVLNQNQAGKKIRSHCSSRADAASAGALHGFSVLPSRAGREITFSGASPIQVTDQEMELLRMGQAPPDWHPLSVQLGIGGFHCMVSNPFMVKDSAILRENDQFAFALQRSYPKTTIVRGNFGSQPRERITTLATFALPEASELELVVSNPHPETLSGRTLGGLLNQARSLQVHATAFTGAEKYAGHNSRAVFVVAGESDDDLPALVHQLAGAGYLKDNIIVLITCAVEPGRRLLEEIDGRYGAAGVFSFDAKMDGAAICDFFAALHQQHLSNPRPPMLETLNKTANRGGYTGILTVSM